MNDARDISGPGANVFETIFQTGALRLLLLGMYGFVARALGRRLTRSERAAYQERAWRVRKAVAEVRREQNIPNNNKRYMAKWSGDDDRRRWNRRMWPIWQYSRANHPPKYRRIKSHVQTIMQKFGTALMQAIMTGQQAAAHTQPTDNQKTQAPP